MERADHCLLCLGEYAVISQNRQGLFSWPPPLWALGIALATAGAALQFRTGKGMIRGGSDPAHDSIIEVANEP